jgi:hypothetical protein
MTTGDLMRFWSRLGHHATVHPADDRSLIEANGFAVGLVPLPWNGPIRTSHRFVALLNPGLDPNDVPYERDHDGFRRRLRENLRGDQPYLYFDTEFADHPGCAWATKTFGFDWRSLAKDICALQLVAYHSKSGREAIRVSSRLRSSATMKAWLHATLLPQVRAGDAVLVVGRGAVPFGVAGETETPNFIRYETWEPRRALMTDASRGGKALRAFSPRNS